MKKTLLQQVQEKLATPAGQEMDMKFKRLLAQGYSLKMMSDIILAELKKQGTLKTTQIIAILDKLAMN